MTSFLRIFKKSESNPEEKPKTWGSRVIGEVIDFVKVLLLALFLAWNIRSILFSPYLIPSESMVPTLLVGDYVFVTKYDYGWSSASFDLLRFFESDERIQEDMPRRGDVIVFKNPADPNHSEDYIKRLVGLPGDRVQVRQGTLYLNGEAVRRERIEDLVWTDRSGKVRRAAQYLETLPPDARDLEYGLTPRQYQVIETLGNRSLADNTPEFLVPSGHLFFMGDNRDESLDSRFSVGFVPLTYLVGKAQSRIFSIGDGAGFLQVWRWPSSVRTNRLFTSMSDTPTVKP